MTNLVYRRTARKNANWPIAKQTHSTLILRAYFTLYQYTYRYSRYKSSKLRYQDGTFERLSGSILSESKRAFHRGGIAEIPWPKIVGPAEILNGDRLAGDRSRNTWSRFASNRNRSRLGWRRVVRALRRVRKIDPGVRWIDIDRPADAWTLPTRGKNPVGRTKAVNQAVCRRRNGVKLGDGKGWERERRGGRKTSVRWRPHRKYSSEGFGGEYESSTKVYMYV